MSPSFLPTSHFTQFSALPSLIIVSAPWGKWAPCLIRGLWNSSPEGQASADKSSSPADSIRNPQERDRHISDIWKSSAQPSNIRYTSLRKLAVLLPQLFTFLARAKRMYSRKKSAIMPIWAVVSPVVASLVPSHYIETTIWLCII